jgi:hypothetical protein
LSGFSYSFSIENNAANINLVSSVDSYTSLELCDLRNFTFLNQTYSFPHEKIDWNFDEYGKLWTYNLCYFDFLNQRDISKDDGIDLVNHFIDNISEVKDGLEPFPISLRGINWVKFLLRHNLRDSRVDASLYAQYQILLDNLEYHLLGNHLLENGFSLLFGAYYFNDKKLYSKAEKILKIELNEQILEDGAHFELSPMYHQIMLFRMLDCLNLIQSNPELFNSSQSLKDLLIEKTTIMFSWLKRMTFSNGDIPLFNDSAFEIAPTPTELYDYAEKLNLNGLLSSVSTPPVLSVDSRTCGYRTIQKENYECILDIGHIGPDYIPGHAHADTFNFVLYIKREPFIIDTGLSTYEVSERRMEERGTSAHNTVVVKNSNSSEVWGGFRVANRAYITNVKESEYTIRATHNGYYKRFGVLHSREWLFEDDKIIINDSLNKKSEATAFLHFHPDVTEGMIADRILINNSKEKIQEYITKYQYAPEFNKLEDALMLKIPFIQTLTIEIGINIELKKV